jgi:hypothetical protein
VKHILCIIVAAALLCGCGTVEQSRANKLAKTAKLEDYGPKPPDDYVKQEEAVVLAVLKDPDSAKFLHEEGSPQPAIIPSGLASPTPLLIWVHTFEVNAKNSYGGYVGATPYQFAWRDGKIVAFFSAEPGSRLGSWTYLK